MAHGRQIFLDSAADMRWLVEVHLPATVKVGTFKSAILYGNEDSPSRVELFKAKSPKVTDTCVVYQYSNHDGRLVRTGTSKPGIG